MRHIELTTRAQKDLTKLGPGRDRERILKVLGESLAQDVWPRNFDVKELKGAEPWQRLRVGDWRILLRVADEKEVAELQSAKQVEAHAAVFIARIVNRRDLERAITTLR